MIPSNFCSITLFKMFVVFEIYEVKDSPVWAPKIPDYVIYDLKFIVQIDIVMIYISCYMIDNKMFMVLKISNFFF